MIQLTAGEVETENASQPHLWSAGGHSRGAPKKLAALDGRSNLSTASGLPTTPTQAELVMAHSTNSLWSPGSDAGSSMSPGGKKSRPGTGRFNPEELSCFRRLPTPSATYSNKLEVYLQSPQRLRKVMSEGGLPPMRVASRFQSEDVLMDRSGADTQRTEPALPDKQCLLPLEEKTAKVLDEIYPKRPPSRPDEGGEAKQHRSMKKVRSLTETSGAETSKAGASGSPSLPSEKRGDKKDSPQKRLLQFRQKIMDKFSTMRTAFEMFAADDQAKPGAPPKELSKKEFSRFLGKHFGNLPKEEHDKIFDFLDTDKSGSLSLQEFHMAIESAEPVKGIEELRKKWIALGYSSMRQALSAMEISKESRRHLNVHELGIHLSKAGIEDEGEHQNIFNAICDPLSKNPTVTLEMLASALAAVSPALLLEEVRDKLLKRFGSLIGAFGALDLDQGESLDSSEFIRFAVPAWKMTSYEASKAFRLIDVDNSRKVSKSEFIAAMTLSEPNLYLDDIRRKVRQRFRSLREIMRVTRQEEQGERRASVKSSATARQRASTSSEPGISPAKRTLRRVKTSSEMLGGDLMQDIGESIQRNEEELSHAPEDYQSMLAKAHLSQEDTRAIFDLVDINRDGKLSSKEFEEGIRLFAPSCVLEDLRMACLRKHDSIAHAFASLPVEKKEAVIDTNQLQQILQELDLWDETFDWGLVVDIVECSRDGGFTICELMAALQAGSSGTQVRLSPEARDARARQQVMWQMAPFHRGANELRAYVREKPGEDSEWWKEKQRPQTETKRKKRNAEPTTVAIDADLEDDRVWGKQASKEAADGTKLVHGQMRHSYTKVSKHLHILEKDESGPMLDKLQNYYSGAGDAMMNSDGLLTFNQSRLDQFHKSSHHYTLLTRPPGGP